MAVRVEIRGMAKVIAWSDNAWGSANRLTELAAALGAAPRP